MIAKVLAQLSELGHNLFMGSNKEPNMDNVIIIEETIEVTANGEIVFPDLTDEEIKAIQQRFAAARK
jgi:2,4-dienoyl-CoA reductase-like NADH-dependent reductase (Old Yellow Enzyme family)